MKTDYSFNRNQLLALSTLLLLSPMLRLFPSISADYSKQAAWLSPLAALPFILGYIYFLTRFMNCAHSGEGLSELTLRCLGEKLGRIALFIVMLWILIYAGYAMRVGADRIISTVFPRSTPALFIISTCCLGLFAGLGSSRSLVRIAKIVLPIVLGVLLLVLAVAINSIKAINLLPITGHDALPVLKSTMPVADVVCTIAFLSCFLGDSARREPKAFRGFALWAAIICVLLTVLSIAIIGNFGAELSASLTRPFFTLVRNMSLFHGLERVEALVVCLWIYPDFLLLSVCIYVAQHGFRLILGENPKYNGEKLSDMSKKRWVTPLCVVFCAVAGCLIAPDPIDIALWSGKIMPFSSAVIGLVFIPGCFIAGKIRKTI